MEWNIQTIWLNHTQKYIVTICARILFSFILFFSLVYLLWNCKDNLLAIISSIWRNAIHKNRVSNYCTLYVVRIYRKISFYMVHHLHHLTKQNSFSPCNTADCADCVVLHNRLSNSIKHRWEIRQEGSLTLWYVPSRNRSNLGKPSHSLFISLHSHCRHYIYEI